MTATPAHEGVARAALKRSIAALETISCAAIFVMMALTFVDVIGRYVFHEPIFGGTEIIAAILALTIFSGLGVINARDEHITVELFEAPVRRLLSPVIYEVVIQLFSVLAMALMTAVLVEHAYEAWKLEKYTTVLEMPVWYVSATIAVFAVISVLSQVTGVVLKILDTAASANPEDSR